MSTPAAMCVHEDGTEHLLPVQADGTARFSTSCTWPAPPDVTALAVDLVGDALALVSQLVDDALPMLAHAPWATAAQRERLRETSEYAGQAWAALTLALGMLGAEVPTPYSLAGDIP